MTLADNLKIYRKQLGLTQKEMAERLNMNARTYASYERGERDISTAALLNICSVLGISSDELLKGINSQEPAPQKPNGQLLDQSHIYMIPVYESVSAGFGAYADDRVAGYEPVYLSSEREAKETIAINVKGDSMYPKIEEGDLVVVHQQDYFENGDIVVAVVVGDGEGFVKRAFQSSGKLSLESINPSYPPMTFSGVQVETVRIMGVVKKIIKTV